MWAQGAFSTQGREVKQAATPVRAAAWRPRFRCIPGGHDVASAHNGHGTRSVREWTPSLLPGPVKLW